MNKITKLCDLLIENKKGRIKINYFISLIGLHNTLIWYIKEKEE